MDGPVLGLGLQRGNRMTQGPQKYADPTFKEAVQEEVCEQLAEGLSIVSICRRDDMPSLRTVMTWQADDKEFAAKITRAREAGYLIRGELAAEAAKTADDPQRGRLAFDAERWYLGKLSNAFSDKQKIDHQSTDGSMTPKLGLDMSKLSAEALREIAALAPDA